jgi:hypothetical protein
VIKLALEKQSDSQFSLTTVGLIEFGHLEVRATVCDSELIRENEAFLHFVANYIVTSGNRIRLGETMLYGYWLVKFQDGGLHTLETWEYNANATEFIKGINLTLQYWREQHLLCQQYSADFRPPRPDKLTVISKGVLDGLPVQGVRYPSPSHMSGWWITTDQYDGNINSLIREHTYRVTAARPDLAKYLALPEGFRFDLSTREDIWRDENVSSAT